MDFFIHGLKNINQIFTTIDDIFQNYFFCFIISNLFDHFIKIKKHI